MDRDFVLQSAIKQNTELIVHASISLKAMEETLAMCLPEIHARYQQGRQNLESEEYGRKLAESVTQLQRAFQSIPRPESLSNLP
jgi:hypothetical protein